MKIVVNDCIHLSELVPADKPTLIEHLKEKAIYDQTLRIPYPYTETDADQWFAVWAKSTLEQGQPGHWAIRNEEEGLIGACGFDGFKIGESHRAELGYWLAKPYWGRGIMTAVVRRACEFAFHEWNLVKITAYVFAPNAGSARVLQKCGFEQEGYLKNHFQKGGQFLDARIFGLQK
jgi:ribosomal-protein-alanine N-acetyltransferase